MEITLLMKVRFFFSPSLWAQFLAYFYLHFCLTSFIMHHHFSSLIFQCDTSALGGSPSSTFTCSTASPCSESPSSTLNTSAGAQPSAQPLSLPSPQCSSSTSPSGTLCSPVKTPAPCAVAGPPTRSSPGPPTHSPTSTLESKDSGIIGESFCGLVLKFLLLFFLNDGTCDETCTVQEHKCIKAESCIRRN